jgi:ActR/RegA family two-component response regulator/formate hydrogenlyase subunit 6/NADH:ubiquinone oxidoreductase subunit I
MIIVVITEVVSAILNELNSSLIRASYHLPRHSYLNGSSRRGGNTANHPPNRPYESTKYDTNEIRTVSQVKTRSVLIVDDEQSIRESLSEWLTAKNFQVATADDGELALTMISETHFDVVVLDIRLSTKSGVEILKEARRYRPNIKAIMITGYPSVETAVEAMKLGAIDYLIKPFDPETLELKIEEAIKPKFFYASLHKNGFDEFVSSVMRSMTVFGVKKHNGKYAFDRLTNHKELALNYDVTLLPPKKYLLPQVETLMQFKLGKTFDVVPSIEREQRVLIGVHPDDLTAIELLDQAFLKSQPDPFYIARRENTAIIAVDNLHPSPTAFCPSVGTAIKDSGFDLLLTDLGDQYVITIGSARGKRLLEEHAEATTASDIEVLAAKSEQAKALKRYQNTLSVPISEIPKMLDKSYESKYWERKAENCLNCGSCVMVCPTCFCFDIQDEVDVDLSEGERKRSWDGCVLSDFAKVASGENFRHNRGSRLRHRMFRKGKYVFERYGGLGCVGCGRCVGACLPDIASPLKVFNELKEL